MSTTDIILAMAAILALCFGLILAVHTLLDGQPGIPFWLSIGQLACTIACFAAIFYLFRDPNYSAPGGVSKRAPGVIITIILVMVLTAVLGAIALWQHREVFTTVSGVIALVSIAVFSGIIGFERTADAPAKPAEIPGTKK
ncbi:MAG: hypothetical protein PHI63_05380 [Patescibacteria group bacterium]|nr:hypothetical protein [Patescibacteria group bacterium]